MHARIALALTFAVSACGPGIPSSSGLNAVMRIENGRFVMAPFPSAVPDGGVASPMDGGPDASVPPTVNDIESVNNTVRPGQMGMSLTGRVSSNGLTVAIGLEGDIGYWVVPLSAQDIENPPDIDFSALADFSLSLAPGDHRILFAAGDANGNFGPASTLDVTATMQFPMGELVVSLTWDQNMDLDLLVIQPDGTILSSRGVRTPTGTRVTVSSGARVDLDSNAMCVIDGARQEDAIWDSPPPGTYEAHVLLYDACGLVTTGWQVHVAREGNVIGTVLGVSNAREVDDGQGGPNGPGQVAVTFAIGN